MNRSEPPDPNVGPAFRIRPALEGDSRDILKLVLQAGINPLGLKWERFTVAVNTEDQVVGCGQLKPHRDGSLELASLAVQEEWRGQGVGGALIESLIERASEELWLMCRSPLTELYARFGFSEVEEDAQQPSYFRRIRRLAGLIHRLANTGEYLAIMVRR